jgi:hypothetical protein
VRNIKNRIKEWAVKHSVIEGTKYIVQTIDLPDTLPHEETIILAALAHYCPTCDIGFKFRNGKKNHDRLKHKV